MLWIHIIGTNDGFNDERRLQTTDGDGHEYTHDLYNITHG